MTPKEKAFELVESFHQCMYHDLGAGKWGYVSRARQCAKICIDEIIKTAPVTFVQSQDSRQPDEIASLVAYWKSVKEEIDKL